SADPLPESDPFAVVADRLARFRMEPVAGLPPFQGGAAGLFGYDLCHHLERLPRPRFDDFALPDMAIGIFDLVLSIDHVAERAWLVATGYPEVRPRQRRERAERRVRQIQALMVNGSSLIVNGGRPRFRSTINDEPLTMRALLHVPMPFLPGL